MIPARPPIVRIEAGQRPALATVLGCHGIPDRRPVVGSRRLPICARCVGMLAGYLCSPLVILAVGPVPLVFVGFALLLPMAIDGARQATTSYWSTNRIRFVTGWLGGMGQIALIAGLTGIVLRAVTG